MPIIREPDGYDLWLGLGMRDVVAASELVQPCDAVLPSQHADQPRIELSNDDEECAQPVEVAEAQKQLFI
jgi:hypothetical protein